MSSLQNPFRKLLRCIHSLSNVRYVLRIAVDVPDILVCRRTITKPTKYLVNRCPEHRPRGHPEQSLPLLSVYRVMGIVHLSEKIQISRRSIQSTIKGS